MKLRAILSLYFLIISSFAEKILFFIGSSSHSHLAAMMPLAIKLADNGHEVTILTPTRVSKLHRSIKVYCPAAVLEVQEDTNKEASIELIRHRLDSKYGDYMLQSTFLFDINVKICRTYYEDKEFKRWIQESHFDLVIIDAFGKECGLPLAYIFKAKSILFSPHTLLVFDADTHGLPPDSSSALIFQEHPFLPDSFQKEMQSLLWYYGKLSVLVPAYEGFLREALGLEDMPSLVQLERQTALMLVNVHFSYETARSLPPYMVPIGGIDCKESQGLENGTVKTEIHDPNYESFVFVSFGSYLRISAAPTEFLQAFFDAFEEIPEIKFLWKWEGEAPIIKLPRNVFLHKWFPQQDVLAHRKCKGFITHGGLNSLQQSVFHAKPIIVVPFFGDQPQNARLASYNGNGIHLEPSELTKERLKDAIQQMVYTDKYSKKAQDMSRQFKDRPMSPGDTALWWTEYVLRHENFANLKARGLGQYWWERRMLHFWGIVFLFVLITISGGIFAVIVGLRFVRRFVGYGNGSVPIGKESSKTK